MINIIVPVYKGVEETDRCLNALKESDLPDNCKVTIINDSSPEPEMVVLLEKIINATSFRLEKNLENLGFVATINKGISLYPDHDVVLLNNDTEVPKQWLQRLSRCAYSATDIGTVTPFSNNATICSYPRFCTENELPDEWSTSDLDRLFQEANKDEIVDIPTAVGFCMYIKRDCLTETSLFDEKLFGRGYGEENDFCMRASAKGWRHVLCADLFVFHSGAVSFGHGSAERITQQLLIINKLHPKYPKLVTNHIETDPALQLRQRVDLLRIVSSKKSLILFVSHALDGGVLKNEKDLAYLFKGSCIILRLTPSSDNIVFLKWWDENESLCLRFTLPDELNNLIDCLKILKIDRIHYHHLLDLPTQIKNLPKLLTLPYDVTIHDYYMICPRIALIDHKGQYCGEPNSDGCLFCLKNAPDNQRDISQWRNNHFQFLSNAERIFCPSYDLLSKFFKYFKLKTLIYAPHPEISLDTISCPNSMKISTNEYLRVMVIGGLSTHKGADLLEAVAKDARQRNLPVEYILLGHAWRNLRTKQKTNLTVLGKYDNNDLQNKIQETGAHLVWFPALWPETYSYTLSAALIANLPIVAPNIGAFIERLHNRQWTWICPWEQSVNTWNNFFADIRKNNFISGYPPILSDSFDPSILPEPFNWKLNYIMINNQNLKNVEGHLNLIKVADNHSRETMTIRKKIIKKIRIFILIFGFKLRSYPVLSPIARIVAIKLQYKFRHYLLRNR